MTLSRAEEECKVEIVLGREEMADRAERRIGSFIIFLGFMLFYRASARGLRCIRCMERKLEKFITRYNKSRDSQSGIKNLTDEWSVTSD